MATNSAIYDARAAVISNLVHSDPRFRQKQLHALHDTIITNTDSLSRMMNRVYGMQDVDIEREILIFAREIHAHLQNVKHVHSLQIRQRASLASGWRVNSELGLVLLVMSSYTPNPVRRVLSAVAAAIAAGNVVVLASVSHQDPLMDFLKQNVHTLVSKDVLHLINGLEVNEGIVELVDQVVFLDGTIAKPETNIRSRKILHMDALLSHNIVILDEHFRDISYIASILERQMSRNLDPTEVVSIVFVHRPQLSNLQAQVSHLQPTITAKDTPWSAKTLGTHLAKAPERSVPLIMPYDSLEQIVDVLQEQGESIYVLSYLGQPRTDLADYLTTFLSSRIISFGAMPEVVPLVMSTPTSVGSAPEGAQVTLYDTSLFSRQTICLRPTRANFTILQSITAMQSSYKGLVTPLTADHSGSRIGFFDQVVYTLVAVALITLGAVAGGGFYSYRLWRG